MTAASSTICNHLETSPDCSATTSHNGSWRCCRKPSSLYRTSSPRSSSLEPAARHKTSTSEACACARNGDTQSLRCNLWPARCWQETTQSDDASLECMRKLFPGADSTHHQDTMVSVMHPNQNQHPSRRSTIPTKGARPRASPSSRWSSASRWPLREWMSPTESRRKATRQRQRPCNNSSEMHCQPCRRAKMAATSYMPSSCRRCLVMPFSRDLSTIYIA